MAVECFRAGKILGGDVAFYRSQGAQDLRSCTYQGGIIEIPTWKKEFSRFILILVGWNVVQTANGHTGKIASMS